MRVRLLAFASAAEALGEPEMDLELPESSRVRDLRAHLRREHSAVEALWSRLAIAVDGEIVNDERQLADGSEVALLPPVSGGSGPHAMAPGSRLTSQPIEVGALYTELQSPDCGAVVSFIGTVRDHFSGRAVSGITYTAYEPMAEERLETIERQIEAQEPSLRLRIVHRLGELQVGDASIAIVAASPHRAAAFAACRHALERVKKEVPIWKRERYADGDRAWREDEPLSGSEDVRKVVGNEREPTI